MKGWKDLFREHILERGRNYFYEGAVTELRKTCTDIRLLLKEMMRMKWKLK